MRDPLDDFRLHDMERADREAKMPVCDSCGDICQGEHYWKINGKIWCEECLDDCRHYVEDYNTDEYF